jgi:hypothetical protein
MDLFDPDEVSDMLEESGLKTDSEDEGGGADRKDRAEPEEPTEEGGSDMTVDPAVIAALRGVVDDAVKPLSERLDDLADDVGKVRRSAGDPADRELDEQLETIEELGKALKDGHQKRRQIEAKERTKRAKSRGRELAAEIAGFTVEGKKGKEKVVKKDDSDDPDAGSGKKSKKGKDLKVEIRTGKERAIDYAVDALADERKKAAKERKKLEKERKKRRSGGLLSRLGG